VASVTGIGGMAGGIGGALVSVFVGKILDHYKAVNDATTGYTIVFTVCALIYLIAWAFMKLLVPKMKIVRL
jgi:ACS family hexuronate transporter-like MFS transporter